MWINKDNIVSISTYPEEIAETPSVYYHKGDIEKRKIKIFGITLRKEKRYSEDLYHYCFEWNLYTLKEVLRRSTNVKLIGNELYRKAYIYISMADGKKEFKYFESDKEMEEFISEFDLTTYIEI